MSSSKDVSSLMSEAAAHHQAGRLGKAEALYRRVLENDPSQADALHWLGVLCQQNGDSKTALDLIGKAVELRPQAADFVNNLGNIHMAREETDDAVACYERRCRSIPRFPTPIIIWGYSTSRAAIMTRP